MKKEQKQLNKIAKKYDLELILLFGSQVDKKFLHRESDFDIAYLPKRELEGKELIDLNCSLMDLFDNDKIDMVDLRKADPLLKYEIAERNKLLFGDEMDYLAFKSYAFKDYVFHRPLFELEDCLIKKRHQLLTKSIYDK
ncbi:nucleotidyltransferase domain-containing protein [Patescibacteria group bacterium]|nr:nucleotidyltransferase domain-containing protein [Patescibacteria group bacterium]